ncbi:hypothetical protein [Pseudomonas putida]|uniref:hypothetical protein n=1 Tax=Pseudomonas putida TaxID=303 RepID=UPI003D67DAEE
MNRDFRDSAGQNNRYEWAQAFILDAKSPCRNFPAIVDCYQSTIKNQGRACGGK